MSVGYAIAYRLGLTPWEQAGREASVQFNALLNRESDGSTPPGRALDIGCGTGDHAVNLALRGWDVTAVDVVQRALDAGADRAAAAGVDVHYVRADVTDMAAHLDGPFGFLLDVGCFHGLKPQRRAAYVEQVDAVSRPGSTLLMLAFHPGRRSLVPLPRGASAEELQAAFQGWELLDDAAADTTCMSSPARLAAPHFLRLRRVR